MTTIIFVYGISALSIVLGFIALLTQKIYIDPTTKEPTVEVEIKFLGKLKTNIAALAFLFLGIALAVFAFGKSYPVKKVEWTLIGQLTNEGNQTINWEEGTLAVLPKPFTFELTEQGSFSITLDIEEGKTIEDAIQMIDYSHPVGRICIRLKKEYEEYSNGRESLIQDATENVRRFRPVPIQYIPSQTGGSQ